MFQNQLRAAWRNVLRYRGYTLINILGLSLGICACTVIYLIVSHEFSFDSFHAGKDRIYRINTELTETTGDKLHFGRAPWNISSKAREMLPGVEEIGAVIPYNAKIEVRERDQQVKYFESRNTNARLSTAVIAEMQYFSIFRYEWLAGSLNEFNTPLKVILTQRRAREYFGPIDPQQVIGRQIIYNDSLYGEVSGIVKDWDANTDLAFTDFISYATFGNSVLKNNYVNHPWTQRDLSAWVFTKLGKQTDPVQVTTGLEQITRLQTDPKSGIAFRLEPLSNIHFNSDIIENPLRTAHKPTLYGLIIIALFLLILAIINFINLSTAQAMQRAGEISIRKMLGSSRSSLIIQFLLETFMHTLIAMTLAFSMVRPILSAFHEFVPADIRYSFFSSSFCLFMLVVAVTVSLLGGLYPAWILSSNRPVAITKGPALYKGRERWLTRKFLTVFQFAISLVFITGSIVIATQLQYIRQKDLGFSADSIINIETPRGDSLSKIPVLVQKFRQVNIVQDVALQWISPMTDNARGMKLKFKSTDSKDFWVTQVAGDENFIRVYGIKLLAGRNLEKTDSVREFLINETLAKMMGATNSQASLGKFLYWNDRPYPVVGVVSDFHTTSLHDAVTPLCVINRPERQGSVAVKLASGSKESGRIKAGIAELERAWKEIYPSSTFSYRFYDESLALLYKKDQQTATLINISMLVTIFISCMGLFGLALFTTSRRAKEISIRKVLGADMIDIATMLSKDFVRLVFIALLVATPASWYFMDQWLQRFSYRVQIAWWMFVIAGAGLIVITLFTISFHSIKAAIANPLKSLKEER